MIGDDAFEDVHEAEDRNLAKGSSWNLGRNITLKTSAEVKETISLDQTDASRADPLSPLASRLENSTLSITSHYLLLTYELLLIDRGRSGCPYIQISRKGDPSRGAHQAEL